METLLKALSSGGGRSGGSSFFNNGEGTLVPSPGSLANSATSEAIVYVVPPSNFINYGGTSANTALNSDNIIQYISGVYLTPATTLTGVTNYSVNLRVYRAGSVVNTGSTLVAGWTSFPNLTAMTPVLMPWVVANTSIVTPYGMSVTSGSTYAGNVGLFGLQPLDVVTLFQNNTSGGAVTFPASWLSVEVV